MTAIETLLSGLFDYAGLYPPASLSMRSAANNYLEYRNGKRASALARFIVNLDRVEELHSIAGDGLGLFRLSVIATESTDWESLDALVRGAVPIDTVEIKAPQAADIKRIVGQIPREMTAFFEVGFDAGGKSALRSISAAGARAKIRMGGVVADAIPSTPDVAEMLRALADLHLPFKATAGLHHPVRSRRPLTYQPQSPQGVMHGFVNLCCASALLYSGGDRNDAEAVLDEQDSSAFRVSSKLIQWRDHSWTVEQLAEMRSRSLISIGSCSFEEPIRDLESLGWL